MRDIKIFVSCHKPSYVVKNDFIKPVQVGTSLQKNTFENMYHDNEGDNISDKNQSYCELTAQYWAWKNIEAEYYGFFHYRRYMSFEKVYSVDVNGKIKDKKVAYPYAEISSIKDDLNKYKLTEERMNEVIGQYDIITVLREKMNSTVYEQYCQYHSKKDMDIALNILYKKYPEYEKAASEYLNGKNVYFMNMYIMKKDIFMEYQEWLHSILSEYEKQADFSEMSQMEHRITGYISERLFGIFYTHKRMDAGIRCGEVQYLMFKDTEPVPQIKPVYDNAANIVLAANNSFVPYLATMIQSIMDNSAEKNKYDINVLHTDMEEDNCRSVCKMADHKENISIRCINVKDYVRNIPFKTHQHITKETFYRYLIPTIFQDYKKALYMDCDMVVCRDVYELYNTDVEGFYLAAVKDMEAIGSYKSDEKLRRYMREDMKLDKPLEYFQAGVLLMNLEEFRKNISFDTLVRKTLEREWRMMDQDVLNILCQGKVKFLDIKWNVMMNWKYCNRSRMDIMKNAPYMLFDEYMSARRQPCVIHYAGAWKPWNMPRCDYGEEFWYYARRTPYYEVMLFNQMGKKHKNRALDSSSNKRVFVLKPTKIEIAVDMSKVNRLFPAGTRRRIWLRNIILRK